MKPSHEQWLKRLFTALEIPAPDPSRLLHRIEVMERDIMSAPFSILLFRRRGSGWR